MEKEKSVKTQKKAENEDFVKKASLISSAAKSQKKPVTSLKQASLKAAAKLEKFCES